MCQVETAAERVKGRLCANHTHTCGEYQHHHDYVEVMKQADQEPEESMMPIGYRIGSRDPLRRSVTGIAILSGRKEQPEGS